MHRVAHWLALIVMALLAGCAAKSLPGYQITYQGYNIPQPMLDRIAEKFREHGLATAAIARDNVGRVRLVGSYRNEDDVDRAFTIVQSIVGLKSTSPFYPQDVKERNWEREAGKALVDFAAARKRTAPNEPGVKRALVVGINTFLDSERIPPIQGEDDARVVAEQLGNFGYRVTRLLGSEATKAAIETAVARMANEVGADDTLFIYVSSHGALPVPSHKGGDERKMSVIAYDSGQTGGRRARDATDQAVQLQNTAVKDSVFQHLAQRPTRATRVLIDTCYSGEILRGVQEDSRQYILKQNGGRPDQEGISVASWSGPAYTAKGIQFVADNARPAAQAPGKRTAADELRSRPGYTLITATSEGEKSFGPAQGTFEAHVGSPRQLRGSFFTQTFAGYLELHNGQVQPAFEMASRFTTNKVSQLSKGTEKQHPRIFSTLPATDDVISKF